MPKIVEAQTFTGWYDPREDRLRLAVNRELPSQRVDFWITRRFFLSMISEVEAFIETKMPAVEEALTRSLLQDDGKKDSADEATFPFQGPDAFLLEKVQLSWSMPKQIVQLRLEGVSTTPSVIAAMNPTQMHAFIQMLLNRAPVMEWGLAPSFTKRF